MCRRACVCVCVAFVVESEGKRVVVVRAQRATAQYTTLVTRCDPVVECDTFLASSHGSVRLVEHGANVRLHSEQ